MKIRSIFFIVFILTCCNAIAQEIKPCLFIGRYDKAKKGICSDQAWVHEGVNDAQEYEQRRKQFLEEHKGKNPFTNFVSSKQCVIVYEFQKKISGWDCSPSVFSSRTGTSIANCERELAAYVAKYPKEFETQPHVVFTWQGRGQTKAKSQTQTPQGKGETKSPATRGIATPQKQNVTEDFGGVSGSFSLYEKPGGKSLMLAKWKNNTTDKKATIIVKTDAGVKEEKRVLNPGEILTIKYDTKKLEIQVLYEDSKKPETEIITGSMNRLKAEIRTVIIDENGELKSMPTVTGGARY